MGAKAETRVVAVVVTYEPDETLPRAIEALRPQVAAVVIVDNGSGPQAEEMFRRLQASVRLERFGENRGIGAAHNAGIARARTLGATHVLLMDQDSIPSANMVGALLKAVQSLRAKGRKVGAVGPVFHDTRVGKSWPFYRISRFGIRAEKCEGRQYVHCDLLITSGTLIPMEVIDHIGLMNEPYFLEHVDTEWSLRARFAGYELYGVCNASMEHHLGDSAISVPLSGKRVQVYSPYRHYYLFRNAVLLCREPHACLAWKLNEVKRLLYRAILFPFFVPPRIQRLKFMLRGLWDGIAGRTGQLKA